MIWVYCMTLNNFFQMKDLGEASYVLDIEIHRDRSQKMLGLSHKAYIERVLEKFRMHEYTPNVAPILKGDTFNLSQCPKNVLEKKKMESIPYESVVGNLMYAQVFLRLDIAYAIGMLRRYQSNLGMEHWKVAKKVMRYLQGTKNHMLTYIRMLII
jgi:hypothetical protein